MDFETYVENYKHRMDTKGHIMVHPQRPPVTTRGNRYTMYTEMPATFVPIIAIMPWGGNNIEDAILMNERYIRWGAADIMYYRTDSVPLSSSNESFLKPDRNITKNYKLYSSIITIEKKWCYVD